MSLLDRQKRQISEAFLVYDRFSLRVVRFMVVGFVVLRFCVFMVSRSFVFGCSMFFVVLRFQFFFGVYGLMVVWVEVFVFHVF